MHSWTHESVLRLWAAREGHRIEVTSYSDCFDFKIVPDGKKVLVFDHCEGTRTINYLAAKWSEALPPKGPTSPVIASPVPYP